MIARLVTRPRPIPYAEQAPGAKSTRPVSWAASSGPAPLTGLEVAPSPGTVATLLAPLAPARRSPVRVAANDAANNTTTTVAHTAPTAPRHTATPKTTPTVTPTTSGAPASGEMLAKFMGHGALSVRSSVTGRHYRFQGHGDCLKVDKHDMMMLRRIPDLIVS